MNKFCSICAYESESIHSVHCDGCIGTHDKPNFKKVLDVEPLITPRKSRSKYTKGERITTLDELYKQELIIWRDKVYHKGWFRVWQFKFAYDQIYTTGIYQAVKVKR